LIRAVEPIEASHKRVPITASEVSFRNVVKHTLKKVRRRNTFREQAIVDHAIPHIFEIRTVGLNHWAVF
jgi:hypothetical protein